MVFLSKEKRNKIIEKIKDDCKKYKLSEKSLGIMMRSFHVSTPISFFILSMFAPQYIVNCVVVLLVVIFFMFFIFDGCILSMIENKICNDDFTIADPFLEMLQWEKSSKNRFKISCIVGGTFYVSVAIIYYVRFYTNFTLFN
jgi:hypothetical protein